MFLSHHTQIQCYRHNLGCRGFFFNHITLFHSLLSLLANTSLVFDRHKAMAGKITPALAGPISAMKACSSFRADHSWTFLEDGLLILYLYFCFTIQCLCVLFGGSTSAFPLNVFKFSSHASSLIGTLNTIVSQGVFRLNAK